MARYIDAEALIENIKRDYCTDCNNYNGVRCRACGTDDAFDMIEDAPTASVAPRAEVAREIFEEIEKILDDSTVVRSFDYGRPYFAISKFKTKFAALKKKYTEEQ